MGYECGAPLTEEQAAARSEQAAARSATAEVDSLKRAIDSARANPHSQNDIQQLVTSQGCGAKAECCAYVQGIYPGISCERDATVSSAQAPCFHGQDCTQGERGRYWDHFYGDWTEASCAENGADCVFTADPTPDSSLDGEAHCEGRLYSCPDERAACAADRQCEDA
eukprot:COSAG04_NODE_7827_length_1061_cov_1.417879_2_plen_166_part_01